MRIEKVYTQSPIFPLERLASHSIDLRVQDASFKREEILESFNLTFTLYESLFDLIKDKGLLRTADPLRHPLIFYFGHTAVFCVNKLVLSNLITHEDRIDPSIESLFAVGVDEMSWDDLLTADFPWPSRDEVKTYRDKVRTLVSDLIQRIPLEDNTKITWDHPFYPILMAIEHERIHLETSTMLIRQLPLSLLETPPSLSIWANTCPTFENTCNEEAFHYFDAHQVSIGRDSKTSNTYGWDNEYGTESFQLEAFEISRFHVTNRDFIVFVDVKGYEDQSLWSEEGWKWVSFSQSRHPKFWVPKNDFFTLRLVFHETSKLPLDWPVEVNYHEAFAYCNWKSKVSGEFFRLPTEAEFYSYHNAFGTLKQNIALEMWSSPSPVQEDETMGNVWEWTRTTMYPFKGFQVHPLYDDFTAPTFDDRHNLIKGGSWVSCGNEAIPDSRYAFRKHFFQHAGFRVVKTFSCCISESDLMNQSLSLGSSGDSANPYEKDDTVNLYCNFHYGSADVFTQTEAFPVVCARLCQGLLTRFGRKCGKVMDLGCAVGRTSFELATSFDNVVGIDFSARFIQVAWTLLNNGRIRFNVPIEGDISEFKETSLFSPQFPLDGLQGMSLVKSLLGDIDTPVSDLDITKLKERVTFMQGDACNLPDKPELYNFDCILCCNLIDRLYNPHVFLENIHKRISQGGFLIILSPYTWLDEYTEKKNWLGGKKVDGENVYTAKGIEMCLSINFERIELDNVHGFKDVRGCVDNGAFAKDAKIRSFHVPFVIQETFRKFQYTFSECTIWRKK